MKIDRLVFLKKTRQQQYQELLALSQQGLSPERIATVVGVSQRTVYRWLTQPQALCWFHATRSKSVIDPYLHLRVLCTA